MAVEVTSNPLETYGVGKAARALMVSASTIRRMRASGALPDQARWTRADLEAAVKKVGKAKPRGKPRAKRTGNAMDDQGATTIDAPKIDGPPGGAADAPPGPAPRTKAPAGDPIDSLNLPRGAEPAGKHANASTAPRAPAPRGFFQGW